MKSDELDREKSPLCMVEVDDYRMVGMDDSRQTGLKGLIIQRNNGESVGVIGAEIWVLLKAVARVYHHNTGHDLLDEVPQVSYELDGPGCLEDYPEEERQKVADDMREMLDVEAIEEVRKYRAELSENEKDLKRD